jgi:glycosyltransferase involved in cell wall biosynthesis
LTIRAFNRLCDVGVNAELTIAGDGPMRVSCELERLASPYREQIHILGAVDRHAGERLRKSHQVFTAHSRAGPLSRQEEAFGVAFLEAMAAGMPVVTGQNGGIPEVVEHQESGLLFKSGDVEAHAQCLLSLAKDRESRIKMGKNALDRVQSTFSPTQERDALRRIINKAALLS